jgi:hypothetical protein
MDAIQHLYNIMKQNDHSGILIACFTPNVVYFSFIQLKCNELDHLMYKLHRISQITFILRETIFCITIMRDNGQIYVR